MFSLVSILLMIFMLLMYLFVSNKEEVNMEGESPYECGFEPFSVTRVQFSHRFFLISILFLIFDVEVVLMLPIPFLLYSVLSVKEFFFFIFILMMGFMYEFYFGSLDWL